MSSKLILKIPDVLQATLDSKYYVDINCPAPSFEGKIYKWLPDNKGEYRCSFSGNHDCHSCILGKEYKVSDVQ